MGKMYVHRELILHRPETIDMGLNWLRRECSAVITEVTTGPTFVRFDMEGNGIPEGDIEFGLILQELVPQVYVVELVTE